MKKPNLSLFATRRRISALKRLKDMTKGFGAPGNVDYVAPRSNYEHRETLMKRISMGKM